MEKETHGQSSADAEWGEALAEQAAARDEDANRVTQGENPTGATPKEATVNGAETAAEGVSDEARPAELPDLHGNAVGADGDANLRMILDIPVSVSMEIGRTRLPIRTLLQLNQGSVVELERLVGEPLDVLANGTLIAHGEVVVINEKYGIRLTDVVSPDERVRKLR